MENLQIVFILCTLLMIFWTGTDCKKLSVKLPKRSRKHKEPYKIGTFKVNWYKAEEVCRQKNMRLASIKGPQAAERIAKSIEEATDNMRTAVIGQFWTSGNDLAELGSFYWMSTGEEVTRYSNWRLNTPSKEERSYRNWQISPHCIYLTQYKTRYVWDYGPCSQKRYFICESYSKK